MSIVSYRLSCLHFFLDEIKLGMGCCYNAMIGNLALTECKARVKTVPAGIVRLFLSIHTICDTLLKFNILSSLLTVKADLQ